MDSAREDVEPLVTGANHEQQEHDGRAAVDFTPFSALKQATIEILTSAETAAKDILKKRATVAGKPVLLGFVDEYLDCCLRTVDVLSKLQRQLLIATWMGTVVDEALGCTDVKDLQVGVIGRFTEAAGTDPLPELAALLDNICRQQHEVHQKLERRTTLVRTRLRYIAGAERAVIFASDAATTISGALTAFTAAVKLTSKFLPWVSGATAAASVLGPFISGVYRKSRDAHQSELDLLCAALTADPKDPTCALDAMKKFDATIKSSAKLIDPGRCQAALDEEAQHTIRDVMRRLREELMEYEQFAKDLQGRCVSAEGLIRKVKSEMHEPPPQQQEAAEGSTVGVEQSKY